METQFFHIFQILTNYTQEAPRPESPKHFKENDTHNFLLINLSNLTNYLNPVHVRTL